MISTAVFRKKLCKSLKIFSGFTSSATHNPPSVFFSSLFCLRWFARFSNTGQVIGSSENEEGKIFLNAQSWAVLGDVADPDRHAVPLVDHDPEIDRV